MKENMDFRNMDFRKIGKIMVVISAIFFIISLFVNVLPENMNMGNQSINIPIRVSLLQCIFLSNYLGYISEFKSIGSQIRFYLVFLYIIMPIILLIINFMACQKNNMTYNIVVGIITFICALIGCSQIKTYSFIGSLGLLLTLQVLAYILLLAVIVMLIIKAHGLDGVIADTKGYKNIKNTMSSGTAYLKTNRIVKEIESLEVKKGNITKEIGRVIAEETSVTDDVIQEHKEKIKGYEDEVIDLTFKKATIEGRIACKSCGSDVDLNSKFCTRCGASIDKENIDQSIVGKQSLLPVVNNTLDELDKKVGDEYGMIGEYVLKSDYRSLDQISYLVQDYDMTVREIEQKEEQHLVANNQVRCKHCGSIVEANSNFCGKCGNKLI